MHELLHQLVRRFNLEAAQARQLWQMSQLHARPPALRGWLEGALAAVAALLLGAGLVFWVAANWPEQTRAFKLQREMVCRPRGRGIPAARLSCSPEQVLIPQ